MPNIALIANRGDMEPRSFRADFTVGLAVRAQTPMPRAEFRQTLLLAMSNQPSTLGFSIPVARSGPTR